VAIVLVLGGYGAVGALIGEQLRAGGDEVLVAGRDRTRADRVIVPGDPASYRRALSTVDVVLNAAGLEEPELVELASAEGVAFVDITATSSYVAELERLEPKVPVLLSVGLAPGLTNLLAAEVHRHAPGPIGLAVLLGAGERHGAAATAWAYQLLGKDLVDAVGERVRNYTKPQTFDLPGFGRRRLYRADYSDQHTLTRDLGVPVRTYFGLDSRLATTALAALTWVPAIGRLTQRLHVPGSDRWLLLARGADGTTRHATGHGQSHGTAVLAAVAAQAVRGLPAGVHHLHQVCSLADVPNGRGIDLGP
jgi:saccharopine dehydrogenase-like NADP-dependent oxidoreductase